MSRAVVAILAVSVLAGCGDDDVGAVRSDGPVPSVRAAGDVVYRGSGTVLESPDHGPHLCDAVLTSLPPQCGGVPLVGWDWSAVDDAESVGGTTWGTWSVVGTWDGEALTLTEPPGPPTDQSVDDGSMFVTPCPTPPGGWAPADPSSVSQEAQDTAMQLADQLPDVAGTWLDQSINPAMADGIQPHEEGVVNDPALVVINVQVTEDPARAEAAIRAVWNGALCVSTATRTMAELRAMQDQLFEEFGGTPGGMSSASVDVSKNQVHARVFVATPELVAEVQGRFGDAVDISGLLEPDG